MSKSRVPPVVQLDLEDFIENNFYRKLRGEKVVRRRMNEWDDYASVYQRVYCIESTKFTGKDLQTHCHTSLSRRWKRITIEKEKLTPPPQPKVPFDGDALIESCDFTHASTAATSKPSETKDANVNNSSTEEEFDLELFIKNLSKSN